MKSKVQTETDDFFFSPLFLLSGKKPWLLARSWEGFLWRTQEAGRRGRASLTRSGSLFPSLWRVFFFYGMWILAVLLSLDHLESQSDRNDWFR